MEKEKILLYLKYISSEMERGNFQILDDSISFGKVLKIPFRGDLEKDGYENGFLYIPKGSGIRKHIHDDSVELYRLIKGELSVDGKSSYINMCFLSQSHNIDIVFVDTFIETFKIKDSYFNSLLDNYGEEKEKVLLKEYNRFKNEI